MPEFTPEFGSDDDSDPATDPTGGRLDAAAFHRNHEAIVTHLADRLAGRRGDALEVASGTGQHAVELARAMPDLTWWPSDRLTRHLRSIDAWRVHAELTNLRPATMLDTAADDWPLGRAEGPPAHRFAAIFASNLFHITDWDSVIGVIRAANRHLGPRGRLFVYGAFKINGTPHNRQQRRIRRRAESQELGLGCARYKRPWRPGHRPRIETRRSGRDARE